MIRWTAALLVCSVAQAAPAVRYTVALDDEARVAGAPTVTIEVAAAPSPLELVFPAWLPGAYELRYFGRDARDFVATDGQGQTLAVRRSGLTRIVIEGHRPGGSVQLRYRIAAGLLSDDGAEVTMEHAYLNPGALLPMVRGLETKSAELALRSVPVGWRVFGAPSTAAASYLALVDQPIEVAPVETLVVGERVIAGSRFSVVLHAGAATARARTIMPALLRDLDAIVNAERAMAGPLPFSQYLLLLHLDDRLDHMVALEHAAAASIVAPTMLIADASRAELLHVIAHELFHAWNARRIVPTMPVALDLEQAQSIPALWITEGLTEHASLVALVRAGLVSRSGLVHELDEVFSRTHHAERSGLSLETLSRLAFWPPSSVVADPDAYYAAGHAVSMAIVAELLEHSDGKVGLEELLAALLPPASSTPRVIDLVTLGRTLDQLVPAMPPLSSMLAQWVQRPLSLGELLPSFERVGLHMHVPTEPVPDLGFIVGEPMTVRFIEPGDAFARAGVQLGDRIVRIDGKTADRASLNALLRRTNATPIRLDVQRSGVPHTLTLRPRMVPDDRVGLDARGWAVGGARLIRLIGVP